MFRYGKRFGEEREPLELQWAHEETIRHKARQAFEVERWRAGGAAVWDHEFGRVRRLLVIVLWHLDAIGYVFA